MMVCRVLTPQFDCWTPLIGRVANATLCALNLLGFDVFKFNSSVFFRAS